MIWQTTTEENEIANQDRIENEYMAAIDEYYTELEQ